MEPDLRRRPGRRRTEGRLNRGSRTPAGVAHAAAPPRPADRGAGAGGRRGTHGVRYFHGCHSVGDDELWGVNRRKKGTSNTPAALKSIRTARPDGAPMYVVLDNLSAHKGQTIRWWAKKNRVELCFTPSYASWANPIEAHFGPLRQFSVANSNHRDHTVQTRALHTYRRWRNTNAQHPDVLAARRRELARVRSEKGIRWGGRPAIAA